MGFPYPWDERNHKLTGNTKYRTGLLLLEQRIFLNNYREGVILMVEETYDRYDLSGVSRGTFTRWRDARPSDMLLKLNATTTVEYAPQIGTKPPPIKDD